MDREIVGHVLAGDQHDDVGILQISRFVLGVMRALRENIHTAA
ncbi:MAG: hypothetical protein QM715_17465 [Nibricoccus sp.]